MKHYQFLAPLLALLFALSGCVMDVAPGGSKGTGGSPPTTTGTPPKPPETKSWQVPLLPFEIDVGYRWLYGTIGYHLEQREFLSPPLRLELTRLPHDSYLKNITVRWDGAAGHAEDPIVSNMPHFVLLEVDYLGNPSSLGAGFDTTKDRTDYELPHGIPLQSSITHLIDWRYRYVLLFWGESGEDSVLGGELRSVTISLGVL